MLMEINMKENGRMVTITEQELKLGFQEINT